MRARAVAILLSATVLTLAVVQDGFAPGTAAALAIGVVLLALWGTAALRTGRAIATRLDPGAEPVARALWTFLYAYVWILLSVVLAGSLGRIDAVFLSALAAVAMLATASTPREDFPRAGRRTTQAIASLALKYPLASAIVGTVGVLSVANAAWAFILPPFAHDDLSYHLVYPVEWFQSGTLNMRAIPFGNHQSAYFPLNTEMFYLWLLLPFRHAFHINAAQSIFLVVSLLALYDIFRKCGASQRSATVAASLFCLSPMVVVELNQAYVDLPFACFFLLAIDAILVFRAGPSLATAAQFAIALGVFAGTKTPGLPFTLLILLPTFAGVLFRVWRSADGGVRIRPPRILLGALVGGVLFIAAGGWWYLRNLLVAGNPIFPLHVELFGFSVFDGAYDRSALPQSYFRRLLRLWAPSLLVLFTAGSLYTLAAAIAARRRPFAPGRNSERRFPERAFWAGIVLPGALVLIFGELLPYDSARFLLTVPGLSAAVLLVPLDARQRRVRLGAEFAVAVAVAIAVVAGGWRGPPLLLLRPPCLASSAQVWGAFSLACAACIAFAVFALAELKYRQRVGAGLIAGMLAFLSFRAASPISVGGGVPWVGKLRDPWQAYSFLDRNYRNVTVAATGSDKTFPLYGRDLSNRVRYVNVTPFDDWLFHDYVRNFEGDRIPLRSDRNGVHYYRSGADYAAWLANLRAEGADILFTQRLTYFNLKKSYVRDPEGFPLESIWAERHTEKFKRVYASSRVRIYQILK